MFHKNKILMFQKKLVFIFIFLVTINSFSQQTAVYTNDLVDFSKAYELYNDHQYLAAQSLFSDVIKKSTNENVKSNCSYYIAITAIKLNQKNADHLMEQFVAEYPTSIKRNSAYINVADYYFRNSKFSHARKWYDKVDEFSLSVKEKEQFYFNNAYVFFKNKQNAEAKKYFNRLTTSEKYDSQAKYYLGYIAYEGNHYEEANELFEAVKDEKRYAKDMSYYQADMNFKLAKFQEAIDLGLEQYDRSSPREKSELSKIIGESYFNLENYKEAVLYLKEYKGKKGKWNNTDYYQLGYAYYKQRNYQMAINEFNKIIDGKNAVAQNAFYHLADSYIKLDQKQQALNAFKSASEIDFSLEIKEDAWFNYAKLSYQIGNSYQSAPEVLLSFMEAFPNNENNSELKDLLIDSYITSKNYQSALDLLENNKSFKNKLAYQKVTFFRGLELYSEGNYQEGIKIFNKSLSEPRDASFTARATFWKAECDYQLSNFEQSLIGYKQFVMLPNSNETPETNNLDYNVAYNYFKLKNYLEAINSFNKYVSKNNVNVSQKKDAYVRLGDSYFVTSAYWPALENYNNAIKAGALDQDYAHFQKAISYGFIDKIPQKIEGLKDFPNKFTKSMYRDDAFYELGNTYVSQENYKDGMIAYNKLIRDFPNSSYVPKALLKKALILENTGKSNEALTVFKRVANDFPSSEESVQAVTSAKIIYIDQGRVNDYAVWVSRLDFVDIENSEIDDATFQAAEQPYLENKPSQAISRFEGYISQFPNGKHALKVHFYLAQLYFAEDKKEDATIDYQFVVDKDRNEFTEQALARISQLYLEKKDYKTSLPYLIRLETEADFPQNIIFAQSNAMKASYELEKYHEAVIFADKVLQNEKIENSVKSDAQIIIARSAMKTGDENKAKDAYAEVLKIATGKLAAEALYYDAYFKNKSEQLKASNESIQLLAKEYAGYKYFGAKGLVLMAKNFYKLNDAFQATYILESVIKNFEDYPDIIEEATSELAIIKSEQAKTNDSINIEEKN
jgi:TolA-binding protein